jgi:uncharacterized protein
MKSCDYCGKENEDVPVFCIGCGTLLEPPVIPPIPPIALSEPAISASEPPVIFAEPPFAILEVPPLLPPAPRVLNGGFATAIFGIYLGGQFLAGIMIGFTGRFLTEIQRATGTVSVAETLRQMMPFTIFLTMLLGGAALFLSAFGFDIPLRDASSTGAAWVRGRWRDIALGFGMGILVAALWAVLLTYLSQTRGHEGAYPLVHLSKMPVISQILWATGIVLLAPPIEELLFRGIIYGGYRKSLGALWACALTTVLFVVMHLDRLFSEPTALFGIATLALAALFMRVRTNAIGPCISVHFGYNGLLVLLSLCFG